MNMRWIVRIAPFFSLAAPLAAQSEWSPPFAPRGDDAALPLAGAQQEADVAAGGGGFLLVWEDTRASLVDFVSAGGSVTDRDIFGMLLDAQGRPLTGRPITISAGPFVQSRPRVAWNGQDWLVVWQSERLTTFWHTRNVVATRVSASGVVLDDPPIVVDDDDNIDEAPWDVASDGVNWAVFWQDQNSSTYTLDAALVDPAGSVLFQTRLVTPGSSLYAPVNARAEWAGNRFLVAYSRWGASSNDVFARRFDAQLAAVGGEIPIGAVAGWDQTRPCVATDGSSGFYVAWQDEQLSGSVFGTPVSAAGVVAIPNGADLSPGLFLLDPRPAAAWDGLGWAVFYETWGYPTGYGLTAAQVDAGGTLRSGSPFALVSANPYVVAPAAAPAAGAAQVAWTDGRMGSPSFIAGDLFTTQLAQNGSALAQLPASVGPPAQLAPDLDGAPDTRLLVWRSLSEGQARILAERVDFFGRPLDPQPIVLATGSEFLQDPAVAWDGAEWLVAWEDYAGSVFNSTIYARRVAANGALLDPSPVAVMPGNDPDVAASGRVFLIACTHEPVNHVRTVEGRRVDGASGALLDPAVIAIGGSYARKVSLTGLADRWIAAWQRHPTHDSPYSDVKLNVVLAGGAATGESGPTNSTAFETDASVSASDAGALLQWSDGQAVKCMRLDANGAPLDPAAGFFLGVGANRNFQPAGAWDGLRWHSAWTDWHVHPALEPGRGDVMSALVPAAGAIAGTAGDPMLADPALAEGNPALSAARGAAVGAASALLPGGERGNWGVLTTFRGARLAVSDLVRGQSATFTVSGAEAGDAAWLLLSLAGEGRGACPPQMGGLCLDLLPPTQIVGSATVGAGGGAAWTLTVPPGAPRVAVSFQAVLRRGPGGSGTSKTIPVTRTVQ